MKISRTLFLTRFRPHQPNSGASLRNWQNISAMMSIGQVDVVSIGSDTQGDFPEEIGDWTAFSNASLCAKRSFTERVSAALWRIRPDGHPLSGQYTHREIKRWLRRQITEKKYDLAIIEELPLVGYLPTIKSAGCKVIFDAHNIEGLLRPAISTSKSGSKTQPKASELRSLWRGLLSRKLLREERQAVLQADSVWVCSAEDAERLKTLYGRSEKVTVVANTVDVQSYQRIQATALADSWKTEPLTLVFPGNFAYYPNEDAAIRLIREVMPILKNIRPEVRLILLGKSPTSAMYTASEGNCDVTITGAVDDIRPFLDKPCVVTLPIQFGGGTRLKVLEAFAASRPVVSTRKGAEGINAVDGEHLLLRESPSEIADGVIKLWMSAPLRQAIVGSALELVQRSYSTHITRQQIVHSLSLMETADGQAIASSMT